MVKKIIKSTILIAVIFAIILSTNIIVVLATTTQSDLDDIQKKIDEKNDDLEQIENQLEGALAQIQSLNAQISEYENDISDLSNQIDSVNEQIETAEKELKQAEEDYAHQQELLEKRLVAIYKSGDTTYLDVLLSSKDIVDFISKYHQVEKIAECDQNLLKQIEQNRVNIEETKSLLEISKEQIETLKASKEAAASSLKASQEMKQSYVDELTEEETVIKDELEQFEKDKKEIQEELARIAKENNGGKEVVAGSPSEAGYIFPVAGLNIYNINRRYYPSYPGHTGVDININVKGRSVVAAKAGTVLVSDAQRYANGEYRSYGEYIIIDHHDGTMTLYGHMSPNSRTVSKGDYVEQGQVLGIVGTTGNSTGLHLHFEVRVNGKCVNPLPYLQ